MAETRFAAGRTGVDRTQDDRTVALPHPRAASDSPLAKFDERPRSTGGKLSRVLFIVVIVAAVIQVGGLGGSWLFYNRFYVTTENAQVDADRLDIVAPKDGTLSDWQAGAGTQVRDDQVLGRIRGNGGGPQPRQTIRAPGDGTIATANIIDGSWVTHGTLLASAYNLRDTYITARVDDDEVSDVRPGARPGSASTPSRGPRSPVWSPRCRTRRRTDSPTPRRRAP